MAVTCGSQGEIIATWPEQDSAFSAERKKWGKKRSRNFNRGGKWRDKGSLVVCIKNYVLLGEGFRLSSTKVVEEIRPCGGLVEMVVSVF